MFEGRRRSRVERFLPGIMILGVGVACAGLMLPEFLSTQKPVVDNLPASPIPATETLELESLRQLLTPTPIPTSAPTQVSILDRGERPTEVAPVRRSDFMLGGLLDMNQPFEIQIQYLNKDWQVSPIANFDHNQVNPELQTRLADYNTYTGTMGIFWTTWDTPADGIQWVAPCHAYYTRTGETLPCDFIRPLFGKDASNIAVEFIQTKDGVQTMAVLRSGQVQQVTTTDFDAHQGVLVDEPDRPFVIDARSLGIARPQPDEESVVLSICDGQRAPDGSYPYRDLWPLSLLNVTTIDTN